MFAIAIHGGAGVRKELEFEKDMELKNAYLQKLTESFSTTGLGEKHMVILL